MNVILTQPVEIALRTLGEENRKNVLAWLDHLKNWETDEYIRSHKLDVDDDVYVLKANMDFRVFLKLESSRIVVLDIARRETILACGQGRERGRS
jgi:hypothetical protein